MEGKNEFKKIEATKSKGDPMSSVLLFFLAGVVCLFAAVWIYSKSEDTAYHKVLETYNRLVGEYNTVKTANEVLTKSNEELTSRIVTLTGQIEAQSAQMAEVVKDCEAAQSHCAKLRESMIDLQDKVSKKSPVHKFEGPILVEIVKGFPSDASPRNKNRPAQETLPKVPAEPTGPKKKGPLGRGIGSLLPKGSQPVEK